MGDGVHAAQPEGAGHPFRPAPALPLRITRPMKGTMMKLIQPERNVILLLEPGDSLFSVVSPLVGDDAQIVRAHDAATLDAVIRREEHSVALLIATDETERYDTLAVIEAYRDELWFAAALSLVIAHAHDPARAAWAGRIGIQDYVSLPDVPGADSEGFLQLCLSHEIRLTKKLQRLKALAHRDGLTGLYNHAAASDMMTGLLQRNPGQEFLFAMLDIDYFKQVNDVRGHEFGDRVLLEESRRITQVLGEEALAIRYGGDEFLALVPIDADSAEIAQMLYEHTHFTLEDYTITNSIGIATTLSGDREWGSLFHRADQALYTAKANGRNQYCIHTRDMSCKLDGVGEEMRSETLNLGAGALIHALVNGYEMACHLDLDKVAVTKLVRLASGEYGWSDPFEYIPFTNSLLELVEERSRLRFSEFINPNTLAGRMKDVPTLDHAFTGVDGNAYRATYIAGDRDAAGRITNALMLLSRVVLSADGPSDMRDDVTAIEKCLASGLTDAFNAIWIIHPTTLSRELVSIQTDISRHRRINRLFEGGNYWEDTQGYVRLYVNEEEREDLLRALHPDVLLREVAERGMYTLFFHRRIDGVTLRCEYCFTNALYGEEKVILQLYRRVK